MSLKPLNIFYSEPDPDRWIKYDRYPRKIIRRIFRGKPVYGGQYMVYANLVKGLNKADIPYRLNDYKYLNSHNDEVACIIGKDDVLYGHKWNCPVVFGPSFGINPVDDPDILKHYPIKKLIVPGDWLKNMFAAYGAENVEVWPVGIDTDSWAPTGTPDTKKTDFLIYNKIRWHHAEMDSLLVEPLKYQLDKRNFTFTEIKYGHYKPQDLKIKLKECKYAIFLCEHETQGIAYQQMLSSGVPVLAWDRGGFWQDPNMYPNKIKFAPVSSVPYWSAKCGIKFSSIDDFDAELTAFSDLAKADFFEPRKYILDNLTLAKCAVDYYNIISSITK